MTYWILRESLSWDGEIIRNISTLTDPKFDIPLTRLLLDFAKSGKLDFSKAYPGFEMFHIMNEICRGMWPDVENDVDLVLVAGDFIPSISAQFIVYDRARDVWFQWEERSSDILKRAV